MGPGAEHQPHCYYCTCISNPYTRFRAQSRRRMRRLAGACLRHRAPTGKAAACRPTAEPLEHSRRQHTDRKQLQINTQRVCASCRHDAHAASASAGPRAALAGRATTLFACRCTHAHKPLQNRHLMLCMLATVRPLASLKQHMSGTCRTKKARLAAAGHNCPKGVLCCKPASLRTRRRPLSADATAVHGTPSVRRVC